MDALEFYIGELEAAVATFLKKTIPGSPDSAVEQLYVAAQNVITAWDAENTPEAALNEECGSTHKGHVCNAGPDHSGDHVALDPAGVSIVAHWSRS